MNSKRPWALTQEITVYALLKCWGEVGSVKDIREGVVALQEGIQVVPHVLHRCLLAPPHLALEPLQPQLQIIETGEPVPLQEVPGRVEVEGLQTPTAWGVREEVQGKLGVRKGLVGYDYRWGKE